VHHQTDWPETHGRDRFDIPGDRTSQRLAVLADAAQPGQRSRQYVAPVLENLNGYFERAMLPLIEEIEQCSEQQKLDQCVLEQADDLMADIKNGIL
jgi:hypothetical protein